MGLSAVLFAHIQPVIWKLTNKSQPTNQPSAQRPTKQRAAGEAGAAAAVVFSSLIEEEKEKKNPDRNWHSRNLPAEVISSYNSPCCASSRTSRSGVSTDKAAAAAVVTVALVQQ